MAKKLDNILVVDVESTCDEPQPQDFTSEIIEIGIAVLNLKSLHIEKSESILVKPIKSKVTPFCTSLTTLTQEQVDNGISFPEACHRLKKEYGAPMRTWASYGDYDRVQFERNCKLYDNLRTPFGRTHINVKNLAAVMLSKHREEGMPSSLDYFDLELEGTHHRGIDDALNIAKILASIIKKFRGLSLTKER